MLLTAAAVVRTEEEMQVASRSIRATVTLRTTGAHKGRLLGSVQVLTGHVVDSAGAAGTPVDRQSLPSRRSGAGCLLLVEGVAAGTPRCALVGQMDQCSLVSGQPQKPIKINTRACAQPGVHCLQHLGDIYLRDLMATSSLESRNLRPTDISTSLVLDRLALLWL